jgi:hypothetical protein
VAHHGEALRQRRTFEVLCQSQGGVVLRDYGAEGTEFGEGEIEGHGIINGMICFSNIFFYCE